MPLPVIPTEDELIAHMSMRAEEEGRDMDGQEVEFYMAVQTRNQMARA